MMDKQKTSVDELVLKIYLLPDLCPVRLICGDVNGEFNALFSRVDTIVKKSGPFDILLCLGNFFGDDNSQMDAYKMGTRRVSVPTYVFGPSNPEHVQYYCEEGTEIVPNVVYMGKRGIFTTSMDVKIAYLSGLSRRELGKDLPMCTFEPSDCSALRDACFRGQNEYRGVDILITTLWPSRIQQDEGQKIEIEKEHLSDLIAWLSIHIKPRYHFAPYEKYYERQPYRNLSDHQDYKECATRFIALASVGNKAKEKWIYACSLQPISKMRMTDLLQSTTDETACPYDPEMLKQHQPGKVVKYSGNGQFFFNMDAPDDDYGKKRKRNDEHGGERKKKEFDPDSCWFCLSSPTVEKHLVISVGTHNYLALAKGPLTSDHVLILPIAHHQAINRAPDDVVKEIKKFKDALKQYYTSRGKLVVFFERNFRTSHMQIQCVPVPKDCEPQILEVFQDEAGINSIQLEVLPVHMELSQATVPGAPYFHAELPSGDQLYTRPKHNFPLQFGRDVLSSTPILNCEDKADWKQCLLSKEEEVAFVARFRKKFRPFDFTADADSDSD